ncbi:MAG: hypothetical protein HPY83_06990 [Anaerolineae bacterium]|nr:hypothetical protein [Anaerolineae bacterium]
MRERASLGSADGAATALECPEGGTERQLRSTKSRFDIGWLALVLLVSTLVLVNGACSPKADVATIGGNRTGTASAAAACTVEGICVHERFLAFYREHGWLIGPPIAQPDTYRERLVQYFEAGRLEYVPENPPGYEIGLAYLAEETCGRQPPLHYSQVPSALDAEAEYYPETGHSLRGQFLLFVRENGGVDLFGPPISEQRQVGGEAVQDFVRVQLRQAEDGTFYLAPLGRLVMERTEPPPGLCPSVPPDDPYTQPGQPDGGQDDGGELTGEQPHIAG